MMKKVLSVALSVIMVLSVLSVPGFAADSAAAEYTVSNVSYAGEAYYDDGENAGYAMVDGITSIPDNGKKLVPSVEISASAETTATVIFAVYTEGVLTNAFYETKAVGTTAVEFSKEITVVDNEKETYKVFALGADGKAIAPVSNFPVADGAMEYIVISYADGTEDKYFGADLEGTTLVSAISEARKVANPSIKVVPVDNTTVVTIDIAADFWTNGATVKLTAIDGTEVTYTIMSDMIKAGFTPVLGKIYQYQGATLTKTIKTYEKQYASFEASAEVVNVTVPYGTASVSLDAITVYENGVPKKSSAEEISMDGAAEKEYMVGIGSKEYKFVFKWDDSAPYITNVKFGGSYAARSIVLRADGTSAIGYSQSDDISKTPDKATLTNQIAGTAADSDLVVNGVAIPNDDNLTILALAREDNFVRPDMINYTSNNWAHMTENEAWQTFKVSEPATVYVKMSHANAGEADFVWKEGAAAGWTKATSSSEGTIYYKTFAAGETVNVPSQVVTEEELAFVNAKLATAYPASGEVQFKYVLADAGAQLHYSSDGKAYDDASKTWEAHPTGKNTKSDGAKLAMADGKYYRGLYYRNSSQTGLTVAYGSPLFIAVAFNNTPGEGGTTPEVPPVNPDEPEEPAGPTLSYTTKLALTGEPKTSGSEGTNIANNYGDTQSINAGGIYKVAVQSDTIELNPEDTTVDIEVAYGTEAIVLNDTTTIDLLTNNGTGTANVVVNEVTYTVNVSWKAFAAADMSADAPLLYNLKYYVADKTNLAAGTYYTVVPTTMKLDAASDWVYGEGDVTKVADGSLMYAEGNWITLESHRAGNYSATSNGGNLGRLHLAGESFKSFVEEGYAASKYALNGATLLVAHYQDTKAATVVSPRYTFNSAVKGYVIAAFTNENAALTADGWTLLADARIVTSNKSAVAQGSAETGAGYHFGFPSTPYEYVYVKAVNVGTEVSIKEASGANDNDCNPIVLVATEAMLNVDLEAPVEPEIPPVDPEDPPVVEPTTKLASITYSTAAHLRFTEAATETGATQAWQAAATEYVVKVPIGTGVVTVTAAADDAATPNTLASNVEVNMGGKDEATAEILGHTVKFVWDDTDPYITDVVVNAAFKGRWGVDNGADGDLTYQSSSTNESGALSTLPLTGLAKTGETAPELTKYVYSIATHTMNGQPHMANTTFGMRDVAYEGTNAENSLLSFKVSADATVYVKAVALDGKWEELAEAGWTEAGTLSGAKVYKKDFAAGSYVYLPGTPTDDEEAEGYNANPADANIRYVKYVPSATVETTAGTKTLAEAYDGYDTSVLFEGKWYQWSYDATEGKLVEPKADNNKKPLTIDRAMNNGKYVPVFYVQFAAPAVPEEPVEPEIPPVDPEEPPVVDNSANQLDLTYTTALAVTEPKATSNHANGLNRVSGVKSIYAGGFYMPTLVETATAAVVDHEAKTAVVTVPFGTEVVNLNAATVAGTGIDLADNATVAMLNDNGAAKTFDVVAGENTYAVTVKWADAADATMGIASTGADVYGVKYKYNDLWAGSTLAYKLIPTKLDMSVDFTVDASKYAEGEAPTELADGVYYNGNMLFYANMTAMNSATGYSDLARYKLGASSFNNWVVNAIIENVADLNNATLVNTGVHYQTVAQGTAGANAAMDSYLTFNVEADGVVYVIPSKKGTFTNDDTWTEVEAVTLAASRGGSSTSGYTFQIEAYDDVVFIKNVVAGEEVTVPVAVSSGNYNPIVIYDAGASYTAPPTPEVPETPVVPETPEVLGDIEDAGMAVLAETVEAPEAEQDAASTDITVEGNKGEEARGEHVVVYVLADGKTFADIQAALALGSGDLVADGVILGMGSATVDENGDYTVDMTLPNDVTSGSYDVVIDDETHEDALEYTAISEKVAAYNAIVTGAADPFADVDLIISTNDIYTGLTPAGKAAVEASVLAKDAVAALPEITETAPGSGEYVGLENIATLAAIIDTRIAVEALNDGADAAELDTVWDYILPEADAESDDIVAVAAAIYEDATALNATGKANVVAAISEKAYETKTVNSVQVSVKTQVAEDFAEAVFVELINNTGYTNINAVATVVNDYIAAGVFEELTSVSTATLSTIVKDYTITSYADFEEKVANLAGGSDTPSTGGTEVVPSTPSQGGTTSGSMSNTTTGVQDPVTDEKPYKALSEFKDAADAAWAAPALQMMLDRNILNGYEDDTIRPNNTATRQEVAKMLVQALSKVNSAAWTGFDDVAQGEWYYSYIATAVNEGIIKGVGDNKFGTGALITREDLSVLIYRYLTSKGNVLNTASANFTDAAAISDYAAEAVNALANAGVIRGYADGGFNPKGNATRAEIAQVLYNVITIFGL